MRWALTGKIDRFIREPDITLGRPAKIVAVGVVEYEGRQVVRVLGMPRRRQYSTGATTDAFSVITGR